MFTTQRLRLRAYRKSDFQALLDLHNYEDVAAWLSVDGYITPVSDDKLKETSLAFFQNSLMFCVVEELEGDAFVGMAVLFEKNGSKNRDISFGISVEPEYQNRGYGSEITSFMVDYAFHNLGMHRVSLGVFDRNERAIKVYEKLGFVEEGRVRKSVWVSGEWYSQVKMGILHEDWLERRPTA